MDVKKRIVLEAENLFLKFGIRCVSMDDICHKLCISKKTLYQTIKDKEELIKKVLAHHALNEQNAFEKIAATSENAIDEMFQITKHVLQLLQKMNPATKIDLQRLYRVQYDKMMNERFDFIYLNIKNNLEKGIRDGIYRDDFNTDIIAKLYMVKSMSILDENLFPKTDYDTKKVFIELIIYHLKGIISEKGTVLFNQHIQSIQ